MLDSKRRELEARLAQVEADHCNPHRETLIRSLRRMLGLDAYTQVQIDRMESAIRGERS